jgi:tetratricopeptide (TPR) repeat protein
MKKFLVFILIMMVIPIFVLEANGVPYVTFTYSSTNGRFVYTQDAYIPLSRRQTFGDITLNNPQDITFDDNDVMYIADRNLGFILVYDEESQQTKTIGEGILKGPTGVHIGSDGHVYVADFINKKAYQFAPNDQNMYELVQTYEKPLNSPFFSESDPFDPTKITTDNANNVYVLLAGNINGLAQYKNDGTFFGYFGGNRIPASWQNTVTFLFFDEATRRNLFQIIPDPVYNIATDQDGLILTTTKGLDGYLKLNIANFVLNQSIWGYDNNEDLYVGPYETIFAVTSEGYIVEYGPDGSVLFIFSGTDTSNIQGLFQNPTGIAVNSKSQIYVIDNQTKSLQVFIPTSFANLVHSAIELYQDGRYIEALEPWQKVLEQNALFDLANQGLGDAYFAQMDYEQALYYYEVARNRQGYSDAFWEVRNDVLLNSGTFIVLFLFGILAFSIGGKYLKLNDILLKPVHLINAKIKDVQLVKELKFGWYLMTHPVDGYYGIKRENKASYLSATLYFFSFFIVYLIFIFETNFLFNPLIRSQIDIFEQIISIFLPFILFVLANYLVCSIRDGEGSFKDVYIATSYSLLPAIIGLPLVTLMSQGITLNEAFLFDFAMSIIYGLTGFYMIMMIKEIHYYEMKATIGNLLITIFTAVMILVIVFIVYLLLGEVVQLFLDIIREVTVRG